jgi:hypothetical protein
MEMYINTDEAGGGETEEPFDLGSVKWDGSSVSDLLVDC